MSKIVDLGVFVKEPLVFKGTDGQEYRIPGEISTEFVIRLSHYSQEIQNIKDEVEALEKMKLLVIDILNLDKSKNVTLDYLQQHFDNIQMLKVIISETMKHVQGIAQDPNSNSPESA